MFVRDKYHVWHGLDHQDDALMAPINQTFRRLCPGTLDSDQIQALAARARPQAAGGWHDAGDYDLRVESQMGTVWLLSKMVTEFGLNYDATSIDERSRRSRRSMCPTARTMRCSKSSTGLLSVLGGYHSMGRLYRGIQDIDLTQYTLLGDISTNTDGLIYDPELGDGEASRRLFRQ